MKGLLKKYGQTLALVVGNGVHRYGRASNTNSWHGLLLELAERYLPAGLRAIPRGVALTEFYDVLELQSSKQKPTKTLQREFCELMFAWRAYAHHERIVSWAIRNNAPILTTNFDRVLSDAVPCELRRSTKGAFTAYYPWESYYGLTSITDVSREFGIWHINGMEHYRQSIRLGLTHYMGSVQRARYWLHRGGDRRLFSGRNVDMWRGANTWLHAIFNAPLLIFGLGLEENEVFLRWLLIERARYFRKFNERRQPAWFVHKGKLEDPGKQFFMDGVGVQVICVETYDDIYGAEVWA